MRATLIGLSSLLIITLAVTDDDHLDKPPLADSLDYLQKGLLESLHPMNSSYTKWSPHWIPADCKSLTEDNNMSATDVEVFNVRYSDVSTGVASSGSRQINPLLSLVSSGPLGSLSAQRQSRSSLKHDRPLRPRSCWRASVGPPHHQPT